MYEFNYDRKTKIITVKIDDTNNILFDSLSDMYYIYEPINPKHKTPKWKLDENKLYYTCDEKGNSVYLISLIKKVDVNLVDIIFKDNNKNNYCSNNISIKSKMLIDFSKYKLPTKFKELVKYDGHKVSQGKTAGTAYNPYWKVKNVSDNTEHYLMHCEPDKYVSLSEESLKYIVGNTWYYTTSGNIAATINKKTEYMHQYIMKHKSPNNDNGKIIQHINGDKLDNRVENLKYVVEQKEEDVEEIDENFKRKRNYNAKPLPDGLKQEDIPKYVCYYKETVNKETGKTREFFKVEKHPKLNGKVWATSKSDKLKIKDKLKQAVDKVNELNKD
jgi:hypothetical protein